MFPFVPWFKENTAFLGCIGILIIIFALTFAYLPELHPFTRIQLVFSGLFGLFLLALPFRLLYLKLKPLFQQFERSLQTLKQAIKPTQSAILLEQSYLIQPRIPRKRKKTILKKTKRRGKLRDKNLSATKINPKTRRKKQTRGKTTTSRTRRNGF